MNEKMIIFYRSKSDHFFQPLLDNISSATSSSENVNDPPYTWPMNEIRYRRDNFSSHRFPRQLNYRQTHVTIIILRRSIRA